LQEARHPAAYQRLVAKRLHQGAVREKDADEIRCLVLRNASDAPPLKERTDDQDLEVRVIGFWGLGFSV